MLTKSRTSSHDALYNTLVTLGEANEPVKLATLNVAEPDVTFVNRPG